MNSINNRSKLSLVLIAVALFAGCANTDAISADDSDTVASVELAGTWTQRQLDYMGYSSVRTFETGAYCSSENVAECIAELRADCIDAGGTGIDILTRVYVSNGEPGCPTEGRRVRHVLAPECRDGDPSIVGHCFKRER